MHTLMCTFTSMRRRFCLRGSGLCLGLFDSAPPFEFGRMEEFSPSRSLKRAAPKASLHQPSAASGALSRQTRIYSDSSWIAGPAPFLQPAQSALKIQESSERQEKPEASCPAGPGRGGGGGEREKGRQKRRRIPNLLHILHKNTQ